MNYFKRFLKFALNYKALGALSIFLNILYALFTTLSYVILMPTLNVLFGEIPKVYIKPTFISLSESLNKEFLNNLLNYYVTYTNENFGVEKTLLYLVSVVVLVFLLKNVFGYLGQLTMAFLKNNVLKDLRVVIYKKIVNLSLPELSTQNKGDIITRATSDIIIIKEYFLNLVITFIREPLNIIFTLFVMVKVSLELSLFIFAFIPLSGFIISIISKKIKKQSGEIFNKNGNILSTIEETISGLKIIKVFNAEKFFQIKFTNQANDVRILSNKMSKKETLASPMSEFLGIVTIAGLLWYGGKMVLIDQTLTGGTFIGFIAAAYNILTPAKIMAKANNSFKIGNAAAKRIFEILDIKSTLEDVKKAIKLSSLTNSIHFNNISFKYEKDYILKNFSLTIPKGKMVALVGQSGSGKSTIANLLTRFYDVNSGNIEIDGTDIRLITKDSLRQLEGVVTQDSILFNDSIRNNIALGVNDKSDQEIINAAKIANAHDFISELPKGYNTNVGDSGNKLSGGQKQRLSIARAVLKNPPIMILDEATSALDTESEKLVQEALENMMKNRTSIVIAHRLSTIQKADLIVVMQKGKIIEQGTHEELINKKGIYKKLVEMQSLS